jgi:hypothetical protein
MFLHKYIDPKAIKILGMMNVKGKYFDNYMVQRFRIEDKKLVFLSGCVRIDLEDEKN